MEGLKVLLEVNHVFRNNPEAPILTVGMAPRNCQTYAFAVHKGDLGKKDYY